MTGILVRWTNRVDVATMGDAEKPFDGSAMHFVLPYFMYLVWAKKTWNLYRNEKNYWRIKKICTLT